MYISNYSCSYVRVVNDFNSARCSTGANSPLAPGLHSQTRKSEDRVPKWCIVGFGFRVSSPETNFRCRFRVSGFGFRVLSIEANFSCPFRVSGFGFRRSKPPLDSPVRCRSHITQVSFSMQSSKTRAHRNLIERS